MEWVGYVLGFSIPIVVGLFWVLIGMAIAHEYNLTTKNKEDVWKIRFLMIFWPFMFFVTLPFIIGKAIAVGIYWALEK